MNHLRELLDLMPSVHVNAQIPRNDWRFARDQFSFSPGQWTWVQPHMVGSKQAGMVNKDYAAGRGLLSSSGEGEG